MLKTKKRNRVKETTGWQVFLQDMLPLVVTLLIVIVVLLLGLAGKYLNNLADWCINFARNYWTYFLVGLIAYTSACVVNAIRASLRLGKTSTSNEKAQNPEKKPQSPEKSHKSDDDDDRDEIGFVDL